MHGHAPPRPPISRRMCSALLMKAVSGGTPSRPVSCVASVGGCLMMPHCLCADMVMKMHTAPHFDPIAQVKAAEACELPPGFKLHLDFNHNRTLASVLPLLRELQQEHPIVGFIEDPVQSSDLESWCQCHARPTSVGCESHSRRERCAACPVWRWLLVPPGQRKKSHRCALTAACTAASSPLRQHRHISSAIST